MNQAAGQIWVQSLQVQGVPAAPLDGLRFAVKNNIAVAGCRSGCGNPQWASSAPIELDHAPVVQRLLCAGASCSGTTWMDEFAFGLAGENPWGGSPHNPTVDGGIVGGSSSGSAAAVAAGLVPAALGTDTGGSVRVPASWCGLWGWRPSHGLVPSSGVVPLAPSLDVVGLLCSRARVLEQMAAVMAGGFSPARPVRRLLVIPELWALLDADAAPVLQAQQTGLADQLGLELCSLPLSALGLESGDALLNGFCALQWAEIEIALAAIPPDLPVGPTLMANRGLVAERDRSQLPGAQRLRQRLSSALAEWLVDAFLLQPVTPGIAPQRGSLALDRQRCRVIPRCLTLNALSGLAGVPEVVMPLVELRGAPLALGLLASRGQDAALLQAAVALDRCG
jgi:amidase